MKLTCDDGVCGSYRGDYVLHHSLSERISNTSDVILFGTRGGSLKQPLNVLWVVVVKLGVYQVKLVNCALPQRYLGTNGAILRLTPTQCNALVVVEWWLLCKQEIQLV